MRFCVSVLIVGVAGCRELPPAQEGTTPPLPSKARLRWSRGLPLLVGTTTVPPAYAEARAAWKTATTAFERRDAEGASVAFSAAAEALLAPPPPGHEGAYRAGRCMAYENIGAIWRSMPDPEPGRRRLRAARVEDPPCRLTAERALERFPR